MEHLQFNAPFYGEFNVDILDSGIVRCRSDAYPYRFYIMRKNEMENYARKIVGIGQSGIYVYFGKNTDGSDHLCDLYIGQSIDLANRIIDPHEENLGDWWYENLVTTMVFTKRGQPQWDEDEITYIENAFYHMFVDSDRYNVQNTDDPIADDDDIEEDDNLEEFIDTAKVVLKELICWTFTP